MCFVSAIYQPPSDLPQFSRVRDIARALGVGVETVHDWIDRGTLPAFRVGRTVRVPNSILESIATAAAREAANLDENQNHDEGDHE